MSNLRIPIAAARRIARLANRRKRPPHYEEWFQTEVAKGLAELDSGRVLSHQRVLKDIARRKAMLARALKKAA